MQKTELFGAALAMLAISAGMIFYEWFRIRAGRPIMKGSQVIVLYWVAYLALLVLGVTTALAAIIK